jgi:hypothetical protein
MLGLVHRAVARPNSHHQFLWGIAQVGVLEEEIVAGLGVNEENRARTERATNLTGFSRPARSRSHSRVLQEPP